MKIIKITPDQHIFTQKLHDIAKPPSSLCYVGQLPETSPPVVAIVGTRKPSKYGVEVTQRLAYDLAKHGIVIVSGLALGVDAIAHKAALDASGITLAVIVNQLPDISPKTNISLARQIVANGGAIISENVDPDKNYIAKHSFLWRNRLVSGLSDAVIITEASAQSGTLNTAGHALNQGREVFVVPGNITSPLSEGCNNLLKQGAVPVTEAKDIIEIIAPGLLKNSKSNGQSRLPIGDTPAENIILQLISTGQRDGEILQQQSSLSASEFATSLTMLEINGIIKPLGANQWTLK